MTKLDCPISPGPELGRRGRACDADRVGELALNVPVDLGPPSRVDAGSYVVDQ